MVLAGSNPLPLQAEAQARRPSHANSDPGSKLITGNNTSSASGTDGARAHGVNAATVSRSSDTAPLATSDSCPQAWAAMSAFYKFKVKSPSDSGAPTLQVTNKSSCRAAAKPKRARAAADGRPKRQWRLQAIIGSIDHCQPTPARLCTDSESIQCQWDDWRYEIEREDKPKLSLAKRAPQACSDYASESSANASDCQSQWVEVPDEWDVDEAGNWDVDEGSPELQMFSPFGHGGASGTGSMNLNMSLNSFKLNLNAANYYY